MMKKYLISYGIFLFIFSMIGMVPIWFLYHSGEYTPLDQVVKKQRKFVGKSIFGTTTNPNTFAYKRILLNNSAPKIIALGSSRVMQFRQHMFTKEFVNVGGAMGSINEGINLLPDIINLNPEIVLLGIDVWWFNDRYQKPAVKYKEPKNVNSFPSTAHVIMVFNWLFEGKITYKEFFKSLTNNISDIGVAGQEKDGFGPDGSYYYTRTITGKEKHFDRLFKGTFERIEHGNNRFEYNSSANKQHIDNFILLLNELLKNNINVVVFFPPFAKAVNERLHDMGDKYNYINDIKLKLNERKIVFYDYSNAYKVGSSDCEFIDGFHGGEITYMRILSDLVEKVPSLNEKVDKPFLMASIKKYTGKVFVQDTEVSNKIEVDFLGLGCNK